MLAVKVTSVLGGHRGDRKDRVERKGIFNSGLENLREAQLVWHPARVQGKTVVNFKTSNQLLRFRITEVETRHYARVRLDPLGRNWHIAFVVSGADATVVPNNGLGFIA